MRSVWLRSVMYSTHTQSTQNATGFRVLYSFNGQFFYDFLLRFRCLSFVRPVILPTNYKCRVLWNRFCKCDPNRRKQKQLSNKKRHNCAVWIQPMNRASFGWVFLFTANFMSAAFSFSLLLHCIHFMDKMYAMIYYQNQSHVKHFALKTAISIGQSWELCVLCGFSTLLCWWQQLQSSNYLRKWMSFVWVTKAPNG